MPDLIIPDSRFEMPSLFYPGRKPVGKVKIDWSHPLTRGLLRYWDGNSLVDLANNESLVVDNGDITPKPFKTSKQLVISSAPNGSAAEAVDTPVSGSENRTFLGEIFQSLSNIGNAFHISNGINSGVTGDRWTLRVDASAGLRVEIQGSGYTSSLAANNGNHFIGCKLDGSTLGDHTLYVDSSSEVASGASAVTTRSTNNIRIGNRDAGDYDQQVEAIKWGAFWNRALSDREIESMRLNPYQFLIPA